MRGESTLAWSRELSAAGYIGYRLEQHGRAPVTVVVDVLDVVPDWDRLRDDVDRVSRVLLRMRQRVVAPTMPITAARWVTDPDFDLHYHLRRVALPEPGSFRQLLDLAETMHSTPLDVNRPLWEATLVEGLHDPDVPAAAAIVWKLSHAVTDGLGRVVFEGVLRAGSRQPDPSPMPPLPSPEDLSPSELTRRQFRRLPWSAVRGVANGATGVVRLASGATRAPGAAVGQLQRVVGSVQRMASGPSAPPSPLLRRRGRQRRVEVFDVGFSELRAAATSAECSLHDAYVAAVCGGLRRYHERLGVPVDRLPLALSIPLESDGDPINPWTGVRVAAPVGETDPVTRMRMVRKAMLTAQDRAADDILRALAPVGAWLPDQVLMSIGDAGAGVDVNVGNLGGHGGAVHVAGARIVKAVPIGPLFGAAATVLLYSLDGRCHIGVHLDATAVSDPGLFVESLREGFDEVIGVAKRPVGKRSK